MTSEKKIIDIALKYGYDSSDSFTKAFTRFHGVTPSMAQKKWKDVKNIHVAENQIINGRWLFYGLQNY